MKELYQNIPFFIDPVALRIGSFSIGWYALMYILAFLVVYFLLMWRIRRKEFSIFNFQFSNKTQVLVEEFILYSFIGLIIGARAGYVFFYNLSYYLDNPWSVVSPFDAAGKYIGIYGMSYHGGLLGVLLAAWYFCEKNKIGFFKWADFVVPAIPAGFFFGRLGNFLNGELYGRITNAPWGMYFPAGGEVLRHPSQLYEAFFEGLVLFLILWFLRPHPQPLSLIQGEGGRRPGEGNGGQLFMLYIFLYGLFRIFAEFFREPDPQIGFVLKYFTLGQILSLGMVIFAVVLAIYQKSKKRYNE